MKKLIFILFLFVATQVSAQTLTLQDVVKKAISNNYLIKAQEQYYLSSKEHYKSTVSSMFPTLKFSYSYTHLKYAPYSVSQGHKIKVGDKNNVKWFLQLSQPIFTGFALSSAKEIAKLGVNLSKLQEKEAILDVAQNAKIAYFNVLLAQKSLLVAEEAKKQLEAHERDAENFYKQQMIPLNDLLKSKVALANAIQNVVKARNDLIAAKAALATILSININSNFELEDVDTLSVFNKPLKLLFDEALQKRPILAALQTQIEQQKLSVKIAQSNYYPHIYGIAQYEQEGDDILANRNRHSNQHNTVVGLQIDWTLFDSFKTHYSVEEQEHNVFALQERFNYLKNQVKLQVKQAYLDLQTALTNVQTAKEALKQAKENYRITNLRYKNQLTTSTEVLDARTYLTQAEMNYYSALYGYYIALAKLKRAIGEY